MPNCHLWRAVHFTSVGNNFISIKISNEISSQNCSEETNRSKTVLLLGCGRANMPNQDFLAKTQIAFTKMVSIYAIFYNWVIPCLFFFIYVLSTVNSKYIHYIILPMTGFELRTSGIGCDRSTNWATTNAHRWLIVRSNLSHLVFVEYEKNGKAIEMVN